MKAVWSFWTKPFLKERRSSWYSDWHQWLGWGLSLHAASRHYPETELITDDLGARILVDHLQLPFQRVSTELNALRDQDPEWWALGKIAAYRRQREPFVHIDADVFLWKPLASALENADVFAQNPEPIIPGASCYRPDAFERIVAAGGRAWLPREWVDYGRDPAPTAACCGIFGGCHTDFICYYANTAWDLVTSPRNRAALEAARGKGSLMTLVEQYLLNACLEYHRRRKRTRFRQVELRYVFDTVEDAFQPHRAVEAGYTHLAAGSKQDPRICGHLENHVRQYLPQHHERCTEFLQRVYGSGRLAHL